MSGRASGDRCTGCQQPLRTGEFRLCADCSALASLAKIEAIFQNQPRADRRKYVGHVEIASDGSRA
jgi:hypothetical protein